MNQGLIDSLLKVGNLKSIKRSGWVREGMPDPESVAEHTFRVSFLVLLLGEELKISTEKLLKMAIVHDIEEAVIGDPITQRGAKDVSKHDHKKEKQVVKDLVSTAPNPSELYKLWEDHLPQNRPGASKDVSILYQIGKIATVWQALEYELDGAEPGKLDEFWENAKIHIKEPLLVELFNSLKSKRKK